MRLTSVGLFVQELWAGGGGGVAVASEGGDAGKMEGGEVVDEEELERRLDNIC